MSDQQLDRILAALAGARQRATYGAVAALVGRPATFLMGGRPRDQLHSWVVNKETGLPTGYEPHEMHPDLFSRRDVMSSGDELEEWLRIRGT